MKTAGRERPKHNSAIARNGLVSFWTLAQNTPSMHPRRKASPRKGLQSLSSADLGSQASRMVSAVSDQAFVGLQTVFCGGNGIKESVLENLGVKRQDKAFF